MYTAFSYVKGTVGWGTKYDPTPGVFNGAPVAGGKWLLNFGKGLTCWVLAPHLVGMITVTNQTYYVSYRVPTFLMPGKYAVCLRGKVDFHNNYVNTNLAADIYGFNAVRNSLTNVSLSVRGSTSRMFLESNNRRFKRIALVWLNDLNVDFTHGKYNAAPAQPWAGNKAGVDPVHDANNRQAPIMQLPSSWDSAWASWPTRGAGRASAEGTQRQVPRCGNVDQRYEFLLRTTSPTWTSTTRAVPTYTPARGHSASCSMRRSSPKVRAIKRVRALFPRAWTLGGT